jgi:DNA-binding MarR family transcriptional regulator
VDELMSVEDRYLSEPGPMGLFTRLARVGLLVDGFQHRCLDPFDLKFIDYSVLRVLYLVGPPYQMSPTELTDVLLRSSGGMTQILDRLEHAGLVDRATDADDRRRIVVELTTEGVDVAQRASTAYARERRRILRALSPNEIESMDAAVRRLLEVLTADAERAAGA